MKKKKKFYLLKFIMKKKIDIFIIIIYEVDSYDTKVITPSLPHNAAKFKFLI